MTSNNMTEAESVEPSEAAPAKSVDDQLTDELVGRAQAEGLRLTGEGGLLQQLTKRLLESALEGEITDHLGYDKHDPAGKNGGNSRNGTRAKTVLTDVGPVGIAVPRDREGSLEPRIVKKRQKRLTGVDEMVISLAAKGLTTGEVQAHLAEVYGADVSRQTDTCSRPSFFTISSATTCSSNRTMSRDIDTDLRVVVHEVEGHMEVPARVGLLRDTERPSEGLMKRHDPLPHQLALPPRQEPYAPPPAPPQPRRRTGLCPAPSPGRATRRSFPRPAPPAPPTARRYAATQAGRPSAGPVPPQQAEPSAPAGGTSRPSGGPRPHPDRPGTGPRRPQEPLLPPRPHHSSPSPAPHPNETGPAVAHLRAGAPQCAGGEEPGTPGEHAAADDHEKRNPRPAPLLDRSQGHRFPNHRQMVEVLQVTAHHQSRAQPTAATAASSHPTHRTTTSSASSRFGVTSGSITADSHRPGRSGTALSTSQGATGPDS
ncbi:hypothetical protein Srut_39980 [Streptomyces rutgersensis]|nr:hypothetical protein Srut_39980 [Streptomyces rutgersensis]